MFGLFGPLAHALVFSSVQAIRKAVEFALASGTTSCRVPTSVKKPNKADPFHSLLATAAITCKQQLADDNNNNNNKTTFVTVVSNKALTNLPQIRQQLLLVAFI